MWRGGRTARSVLDSYMRWRSDHNFCALREDDCTFDPGAPNAALSAASGRSPRTLGGVRSAMSPTGETPPGRRQGDKSKRLRSSDPAPLLARYQAEIFSVCFQQEPHVNKVLLLFVAHAYCALAESRSMLPHTIVAAVCNASYSMQCCLFANIHTLLVLYLPMTA